jgi:hypothetical protein
LFFFLRAFSKANFVGAKSFSLSANLILSVIIVKMAFRSTFLLNRAFQSSAHKPVFTKTFQKTIFTPNLIKRYASTKILPTELNTIPDEGAEVKIGGTLLFTFSLRT